MEGTDSEKDFENKNPLFSQLNRLRQLTLMILASII